MAKKDGFMAGISDFFKKVNKSDTIKIGDTGINTYSTPASAEEINQKREIQVFRQFLQSKNWNLKHIELFDEYRRMDMTFPIVAAALKLYSQEVCGCINTTFPMLCDGTSKSLSELIKSNATNFWVWSYDENEKKIVPVMVDKAISKGFKEVISIKLDDNTELKFTPEHEFLLSSGEWKQAKDFKTGDSLQSIYERYDKKGYLELSDGTFNVRDKKLKFKKAHSIIANEVPFLKEQKNNLEINKYNSKKENTPVCHHKSFKKLNNILDIKNIIEFLENNNIKGYCSNLFGRFLNYKGYKGLKDFLNSCEKNHRVSIIEINKEIVEVGDLVNAGYTHNYAIKCNQGMTIVHNCVSGDTKVELPRGEVTIAELYKKNEKNFYVKSFNKEHNRIEWNIVSGIVNNGIKPVYKITLNRNIDSDNNEWDNIYDSSFKCTDNHKILIDPRETDENKKFKQVKDLKTGDVLWSMYYWKDPECSCMKPIYTKTFIEKIEYAGEEEVFDFINVTPNHFFMIKLTKSMNICVHNCTKNSDGNIIDIITSNKKVKNLLEECFFKNLKLNTVSYLHVKSMLKFGNHFAYLDTRKGVGVIDLITLPPEAIRIHLQQESQRLDDFKYHWWGSGGNVSFEPWEIVHWKIIQDIETEPYGQSILRCIVDTYRRIVLMREALIVYRITRAPQRFLFKIDTSGLDPDAALEAANNLKKQMYKKPLINPTTGEIDHKYNPISISENLYMPTYEGDTSDVRVLEGANNLDQVEDYKIIKDDLFAGLLIPKAFLTFEEDLCITPNQSISCINNIDKTVLELTADYEKGIQNYVYSTDEKGDIKPGKVTWAGKTKIVKQLYKITLDNGEVVECTYNHPFMMRDGSYKRADELKENESLMPLYRRISSIKEGDKMDGYEMVWHNDLQKWQYTHRMVGLHENPNGYKQEGTGRKIIHHKNGNKRNNHPNNLQFMTQTEHIAEHYDIAIKNLCSLESRKKVYDIQQTPEYKLKLSNSIKKDFETNINKRKAISNANIKYGKAKLASDANTKKYENGEFSQVGSNNINYKGYPSKELLEKLIVENKINGITKLTTKLKEYKGQFRTTGIDTYILSAIFNMSKKDFCNKYNFKNSKSIYKELDIKKFEELLKQGIHLNAAIKIINTSAAYIERNYAREYGILFNDYYNENFNDIKQEEIIASYNHKVSKIEVIEYNDWVYDITVEKYHNFALTAGIFIHNCLRNNTRILTNEGVMDMKELARIMEENPDKKIYSLSCNKYGQITSGKILWGKKTKEVSELYRITINNNHIVETTNNHPFLMEDLNYKRADALEIGDYLGNMYENEFIVTNVEIIKLDTNEFVYDLEVEEYHNFALECGIFVHNSNKAALAQEDLRFAGAIRQYQSHYIEGLLHIGLVHLHINGCSKEELESFELQMPINSTLAEKTRNELLLQRFALAQAAWDPTNTGLNFYSYTQVLKEILHCTDEEIEKSLKDQLIEKKISWRLKELEESGVYTEPDLDAKKMMGMDKENNIFSNLNFESVDKNKLLKNIITEKVDKEIAFLIEKARAKPNPKMIDSVINKEYNFEGKFNKIRNNIEKTEKDLL